MLHLLFCVERMEVVVIGELSAAGDVLKSKEAYSVHPIHRPKTREVTGRLSEWQHVHDEF